MNTSPSADAGSRPAIEARNSRAKPGTRRRLPRETRPVLAAMAGTLPTPSVPYEAFGRPRIYEGTIGRCRPAVLERKI